MQSGLLYYSDASFELFTVQVTLMVVKKKKKKLAMSKAMWRRFFTPTVHAVMNINTARMLFAYLW